MAIPRWLRTSLLLAVTTAASSGCTWCLETVCIPTCSSMAQGLCTGWSASSGGPLDEARRWRAEHKAPTAEVVQHLPQRAGDVPY